MRRLLIVEPLWIGPRCCWGSTLWVGVPHGSFVGVTDLKEYYSRGKTLYAPTNFAPLSEGQWKVENPMKLALRFVAAALVATAVGHAASAQAKDVKDVVDTALANPQFSTWARAVKQGGMDSTLHLTPGRFMLFVPTNAAFAKLPPATLKKLFDNSSDGQEALVSLVMRHCVKGRVLRVAALKPGPLKPILGPPITVRATVKTPSGVTVNNAPIVTADRGASNGILHAIDTVLPGNKDAQKL